MGSSPRGGWKHNLPIKNSFHMKKQKKRTLLCTAHFHTSRSNAALLPDVKAAHWPRACGLAARCRHRRLSFAARMKWVCRCSMGVAYNWSTAQRADRHPDLTLRLCYVGRSKSYHERSPTALPRHILSPNHFPERRSRASAWILSPPDGMVGAASFSHLVVRGSATCTCGRWCLPSCAWNARLQCCTNASEALSGSTVLCMGLWASLRGPLRIGWGPYS